MEQPTSEQLAEVVAAYRQSLCPEIDAGGLFTRNNTAHKWKVTYRTLLLRELVAWRFVDLLGQSLLLEKSGGFVGSRIILRSAIETLSILIYCTRKMENIVRTGEGFHQYSDKTINLLLGSKVGQTIHDAINVLTVLQLASKDHPELQDAYDDLSETAHPNFDGLSMAYSKASDRGMRVEFMMGSERVFGKSQGRLIVLLCAIFEEEYNERWPKAFDAFEAWIEKNDMKLEQTKSAQ